MVVARQAPNPLLGFERSDLFACLLKHLPVQAFAEEETGPLAEGVEQRADLRHHAETLGLEQHAQNSQGEEAQTNRCMTAFLLIQENEIGLQLDRQGKSLRLTPVEITPEGRHQSLVLHLVAVHPGGLLNFVAPRMASSSMIELVPDTLGDVDLAVELSKQLEVADGGETGERRGIADDDHCRSRWRSVSRSCSRSSASK